MVDNQVSTPSDFDPVAERLLEVARAHKFLVLLGRERLARWAFACAFLAVAVPLAWSSSPVHRASPVVLALLVAAFALASRIEFEVGSGHTVPTELVFVPMLFLLPAATVPAVVAAALVAGQLPDYLRGRMPLSRLPVVLGNAGYAIGPSLVMLGLGDPRPSPGVWWVLVVALLAQSAVDFVFSVSRERLAIGIPVGQLVRPLLWVLMIDALLAPIGFAAALASRLDTWLALLPLPLLVLIEIFARQHTQRLDQTLELSNAYRGTAFLLGDVVEANDAYTGDHSRQVVDLVLAVCDDLGVDPRSRRKAEFTALLHDIGKIRIPGAIINKPGPLTSQERAVINTHTLEGEQLLQRVGGLLSEVGTLVRSCHEDYDGGGYPDGLAGEEIPLVARIVCACDAYNAMTTDRSYRKGRASQAALAELAAHSGRQFDPMVVDSITRTVTNRS